MSVRCLLVLLAIFPCVSFSQVGINARYLFGKSNILESRDFSQDGIHISAEYHFKLPENRIEFRPGLGYRFTLTGSDYYGHLKSADFDLGIAIYPFDFEGDCDCPTFSKEGGLFKKGFFVELIPGIAHQMIKRIRNHSNDPEGLPVKSKSFVWKMGGAAGLDIGISEHFTLTPMLSATLLSSSEWDALKEDNVEGKLDDYAYLGAGIRITYNPDDNKRRRRN